ncbi:DUF3159 domain-containing protein [Longispora fulva]|uniref:DUF3159 domain-containing protein n=1 Tax=Longispora fulva TaxID=619741 RepID=A0A8J7KSF6_9ACTN|nr:DUF3159 domain-containing protein [Longispora fulva]MBG6139572.1 hypothetical protein [Longispora fulva]
MSTNRQPESLATLLGGRTAAIDATMPPVAFGIGWFLADKSIAVGAGAALAVSVLIGAWRLLRGAKPRAVLIGALAVCVSALIALRTGDAEDFFLPRILTNLVSLLGWAISIVVRWPFLGVIVGAVLGQKTRWRRDPALLRAYSRASWVWVGQYLFRLVVFIPLWLAGQTGALTVAQIVLTWPLVAACLAVSWWVLRRSLPADHPGLRLEKDRDESVQP